MSIIGQVYVNANISHDKEDMLAAFNSEHRLLGVTHLDYDATGTGNDGLAYLTVYNKDRNPVELFFEFYDASTGQHPQIVAEVNRRKSLGIQVRC